MARITRRLLGWFCLFTVWATIVSPLLDLDRAMAQTSQTSTQTSAQGTQTSTSRATSTGGGVGARGTAVPVFSVNLGDDGSDPTQLSTVLKIVALLTILSLAPALVITVTSFTRIIIVLSFLRQALGTPQVPPNQILVGLTLFLTFFIMSPVVDDIYVNAYVPFSQEQISSDTALTVAQKPLRRFMLKFTREKDLALFLTIANQARPQTPDDIPMRSLVPAFMISELKTAFQIGFMIYIPFLVIDIIVSSVLLAMGMMVLPPMMISLPLKLMLFVLVDGWNLTVESLVRSFN